jgi:hypothetical protein
LAAISNDGSGEAAGAKRCQPRGTLHRRDDVLGNGYRCASDVAAVRLRVEAVRVFPSEGLLRQRLRLPVSVEEEPKLTAAFSEPFSR